MRIKKLWELFYTFARIGLFTFGGGYAMLSMIAHQCVEKKGWISHEDMMDVTVMAESTPGPIAINCATYVGFRQERLAGAVAATLGIVAPSFGIIYVISMFLENFLEIGWVAHAFWGIKAGVGLLILDAAVTMMKRMPKKKLPLTIMIVSCLAMLLINLFALKITSIELMILAGVVSLLLMGKNGVNEADVEKTERSRPGMDKAKAIKEGKGKGE